MRFSPPRPAPSVHSDANPRSRRIALGLALPLVCALLVVLATPASAAVTTTDLSGEATAEDLANRLAGDGITVSDVTYVGHETAAGSFAGGGDSVGLDSGVVLSSGAIANVVGPNDSPSTGSNFGLPGDAALDALSGASTFDASVLEFNFVPTTSQVQFSYVFSSEEYNEYVNEGFNDAFGFFVNGQNCAVVGEPAVPVTIDTINATTNASSFIDNDENVEDQLDIEMDGLTVVLTCSADVEMGEINHMKLAIGDAGDAGYDSAVFLGQNSFVAVHTLSVETAGEGSGSVTSDPAGIDCGEDCSEGYEEGTIVELTATPGEGSVFGGWSGDCTGLEACVVTMDQARAVTATFDLEPPTTHTLAIERAGDGNGTITSDPAGIDCGEDCSEDYEAGTLVLLTATPGEGSVFGGWSDPGCEASVTCEVSVNEDSAITATFTASCPEGTDCAAGTLPPGEDLTTVEGPAGNPVSPGDPFAIALTNASNQDVVATIIEEECDGSQVGDPLCAVPRLGGSAGNFQFSSETATLTLGAGTGPVTIGELFYDKSVLPKKAPVRIFYQKTEGDPVIKLGKCNARVHTECFTVKKLASGDQIISVPFKEDPRVTRG